MPGGCQIQESPEQEKTTKGTKDTKSWDFPSFPRRRESRDWETAAAKKPLRGVCTTRGANPSCVLLDSRLRGNDDVWERLNSAILVVQFPR